MLLLEGGQALDHLENPSQHMETALVMVSVTPTIGRSHHHTHSELIHRCHGEGIFIPTYLV